MKTSTGFSSKVRERTVRRVRAHQGEHESQWAAIGSIATKTGHAAETLRRWVRRAERERIKALEQEVREPRQANEILRKVLAQP